MPPKGSYGGPDFGPNPIRAVLESPGLRPSEIEQSVTRSCPRKDLVLRRADALYGDWDMILSMSLVHKRLLIIRRGGN